jgi:L-rhamnose isomerase
MTALDHAREVYAALGKDVDVAVRSTLEVPISVHCWQADDVAGFEQRTAVDSGGLLATGGFPGRARCADEVRGDLDEVLRLSPGRHRINLHAIYAETGASRVDRDELEPVHFAGWMDWASSRGMALDFNPTFFAHPRADSGATLSHRDAEVRAFWVRHGIASRRIASAFAARQGSPSVNNIWIPDGAKDSPIDRSGPRQLLTESLDHIFAVPAPGCVDSVESKLFGLGSEDFVVGSFEFYSAYALSRGKVLCLDMGHFHPTESVADKISSLQQFHDRLLLHASRPMRWDSDHVALFNDDLRAVLTEVVRGGALGRVDLALDFFDASINRIGAYAIGIRSVRKAILAALLEPTELLREMERSGRGAEKLALLEEIRTLPIGAVWNELCEQAGVPFGTNWWETFGEYEDQVLRHRG